MKIIKDIILMEELNYDNYIEEGSVMPLERSNSGKKEVYYYVLVDGYKPCSGTVYFDISQ